MWVMSELRATPLAARVPPSAAAASVAVLTAALVVLLLRRPVAGAYTADTVALVAAPAAAGMALAAALLDRAPSLLRRLVATAAALGIAATLLGAICDVLAAADNGLRGLADTATVQLVLTGGTGRAAVVRVVALAALLALSLRPPRRTGTGLSVAAGLAVAASYLLTGHVRSHSPAALVMAAELAHVAAVIGWIAALTALAVAVRGPRASAGPAVASVSRLLTVVIAALLAGGTTLAVVYLPSAGALLHSAYGEVLLVKLGLVSATLIVATSNHLRFAAAAPGGDVMAIRVLRTNIAVEQIALVAILVVTGILIGQAPNG
jgi:copper transport protein